MNLRLCHWLFLALLSAAGSRAQEPVQPPPRSEAASTKSSLPDSPAAKEASQHQYPPRVFWIIPTFTVTESKTPSRLTPREKLQIVVKNTIDPYTIGFTAFVAGISQAENDMAGYGQGLTGYGKRFGAIYADQASAGFFGGFLLPSVLHQDPRYYRQASGSVTSRFAHALVRPVLTHSDAGRREFNWSGLLGCLAASALSNTYYPAEQRGTAKTFSRWGMGIPLSVIDHLVDEFGPDLQRLIVPAKSRSHP